jgi:hypothetical protein
LLLIEFDKMLYVLFDDVIDKDDPLFGNDWLFEDEVDEVLVVRKVGIVDDVCVPFDWLPVLLLIKFIAAVLFELFKGSLWIQNWFIYFSTPKISILKTS